MFALRFLSPALLGAIVLAGTVIAQAAGSPTPGPPPPVPGFPIGCFIRVQDAGGMEAMKAAGMEFVEVGLRDVVALSEADFEALIARSRALSMPIRAAINFLPAEIMVVGPDVKIDAQEEYLGRAFTRAERLGIKSIVFGSGKSRRFPAGFSADEAFRQLTEFGRRAAARARKHEIVIDIEPLGPGETNTIGDVASGMRLVRAVNHPNFQIVVDYYHLTLAKEPAQVMLLTRKHLDHVRVANPEGRAFPLAATESDYAGFFGYLKRIGYRGGIGIESRKGDPAVEGKASVAFLRTLAKQHLGR